MRIALAALILVAASGVGIGATDAIAGPPLLPGDAHPDGRIDARDAAVILQFDAGLLVFVRYPEEWDVSGDGSVDAADAALILQYAAGIIDSLPP